MMLSLWRVYRIPWHEFFVGVMVWLYYFTSKKCRYDNDMIARGMVHRILLFNLSALVCSML
jgi:hypothetical protein